MCEEEQAILRGIIENPECDVRRLVYADWLDEHGEGERGEFIRVQCAIWRLGNAASWYCDCDSSVGVVCEWCQDREPLQRRERTLFGAIWDRWFVLPELQSPHPSFAPITMVYDLETRRLECHIRRGFVAEIRAPLAVLFGGPCPGCIEPGELDDGDSRCRVCRGTGRTAGLAADLFSSHPIERVELTDREPWVQAVEPRLAGWWESAPQHPDDDDTLPTELMRAMADDPTRTDWGIADRFLADRFLANRFDQRSTTPGGCILFPDRAAALAALTRACVAWGRELAAHPLSPLPRKSS